jgi:hypothetical protein
VNFLTERKTKLKFVRLELYCYLHNKKRLEGSTLTTSAKTYISWMIETIEKALEITNSVERNGELRVQIIKDKYFYSPNLNHYSLSKKNYIHENTVRNWDNDFLDLFCDLLGLTMISKSDIIKVTARG